jgi:hypothetical protein
MSDFLARVANSPDSENYELHNRLFMSEMIDPGARSSFVLRDEDGVSFDIQIHMIIVDGEGLYTTGFEQDFMQTTEEQLNLLQQHACAGIRPRTALYPPQLLGVTAHDAYK